MKSNHITRIMLPSEDGFSLYDTDKIIRCECEGEETRIYFIDKPEPVTVDYTIEKLEELLSGLQFYRTNYCNIVNLNNILKYSNNEGGYIELSDGSRITISHYKINYLVDKLKNMVRTC